MSEQGSIVFGGRYELRKRLARGGMAEVFLAEDQLLGRPVAVKVLFPEFAADPTFVERFRREAQAAANLNHPNIVGVYDWGREESTYYIVMEYVEGRSLSQIIRKEGPLPAPRVAEIAEGIASALGFAHKGDVVHRDMKSGNVIISKNGQVKVADFGIATAISGNTEANLTQTGTVMGTATYFSPEQAQGLTVDGRSDLYSLGVVMYEMLTGSPPFTGDSSVSIAYKHVQEQPEPISEKRPGVPEALQAITAKLMNKDPDKRYSSAADLQLDLQRFLSGRLTLDPAIASEKMETSPQLETSLANPVDASMEPVQTEHTGGPPYPPEYYEPYDRHDRRIWLWGILTIGLIGVLVALIIMLVNFVNNTTNSDPQQVSIAQITPVSSTGVIVPLVIDLDRAQAVELLQTRGFIIGRITTEVRDDVPSDRVLSQNPQQGTELEPGDTIDIIVSVGPESISLPIVVGLTQEEALNKLNNDGFLNIEIKKLKTNEYDIGVIAEQEPEANSRLEPSGIITLQVADGRISDNVPNLAGQTLAFAQDELRDRGWTVTIEEIESETIEIGRIVGTNPPSGTDYDLEESVIIQVSTGPAAIEIPSIIGQSPAVAAATLAGSGFMVAPTEDCPIDPEDPNIGLVVSQTPEAGESVEAGTTITICIGVAIEPTPEPEPTPTPSEPEPTPTPSEPEPTPTPEE